MSVEQTFGSVSLADEQREILEELCDSLAADLAKEGLRGPFPPSRTACSIPHLVIGRTVTIKLKLADFTTLTRARTLPTVVAQAQDILAPAAALLNTARKELGLRP